MRDEINLADLFDTIQAAPPRGSRYVVSVDRVANRLEITLSSGDVIEIIHHYEGDENSKDCGGG